MSLKKAKKKAVCGRQNRTQKQTLRQDLNSKNTALFAEWKKKKPKMQH